MGSRSRKGARSLARRLSQARSRRASIERVRALVVFVVGCGSTALPAAPTAAPAPGYVKGALHVHSSNSGDSRTSPERVASWYAEHGFDFIVFTDHNRITTLDSDKLLAIPGVELTQNLETCEPPPPDAALNCLLHVNALFVTASQPSWHPMPDGSSRIEVYTSAIDEARALGGIAQLNHPNFHWGADTALVGELVRRGLPLFEVANQSSDVANEGDATHPSTETMWDAVLDAGGTLYGTATDDAHQYDDAEAVRARGVDPDVGDRGWVMVHARRDRDDIRDALVRGDFYSSTGVVLTRLERTADALIVEGQGELDFVFTGSGGRVLARTHGSTATFMLASARGSYVRGTVSDADGHHAWIQPIRP